MRRRIAVTSSLAWNRLTSDTPKHLDGVMNKTIIEPLGMLPFGQYR
jgi:hypothetical protein